MSDRAWTADRLEPDPLAETDLFLDRTFARKLLRPTAAFATLAR